MSVRRNFILLLSTAGFAFAVALSMPSKAPGLGTIRSAAPPYFDALAQTEPQPDNDGAMIALREQASFALAQLQTGTGGNR